MTIIDFIPIAIFFVFLLLGMPVAFSLAITGVVGIAAVLGIPATLGALATIPFRTTASFTIVSIAIFILMAEIATASGITSHLFAAANSLVGQQVESNVGGGLELGDRSARKRRKPPTARALEVTYELGPEQARGANDERMAHINLPSARDRDRNSER